jgi:hypothetical protein
MLDIMLLVSLYRDQLQHMLQHAVTDWVAHR